MPKHTKNVLESTLPQLLKHVFEAAAKRIDTELARIEHTILLKYADQMAPIIAKHQFEVRKGPGIKVSKAFAEQWMDRHKARQAESEAAVKAHKKAMHAYLAKCREEREAEEAKQAEKPAAAANKAMQAHQARCRDREADFYRARFITRAVKLQAEKAALEAELADRDKVEGFEKGRYEINTLPKPGVPEQTIRIRAINRPQYVHNTWYLELGEEIDVFNCMKHGWQLRTDNPAGVAAMSWARGCTICVKEKAAKDEAESTRYREALGNCLEQEAAGPCIDFKSTPNDEQPASDDLPQECYTYEEYLERPEKALKDALHFGQVRVQRDGKTIMVIDRQTWTTCEQDNLEYSQVSTTGAASMPKNVYTKCPICKLTKNDSDFELTPRLPGQRRPKQRCKLCGHVRDIQ